MGPQRVEPFRRKVHLRFEVVVVVLWDLAAAQRHCARGAHGREDVGGRKRQMLNAGAEQLREEARRLVRWLCEALRMMRRLPSADSITWLFTRPPGSATSWAGSS